MSSRTFRARTTDTPGRPQRCALSNLPFVGTDTQKDESKASLCFYLTCLGNQAQPAKQIEGSKRDSNYETGFRQVPDGWEEVVAANGRKFPRKVFKWQQRNEQGHWIDVQVWSQMVLVSAAADKGYNVPGGTTAARRGQRTQGFEHTLGEREPVMIEVARAMADAAQDLAHADTTGETISTAVEAPAA